MIRQMRKAQKIKQILPINNGLFSKMSYTFPSGITKSNLDLMFISNYGQRNPSPIVETIQSDYGEVLTAQELETLANSIVEMYKDRWDKLGNIYDIEYDPIHNYLDEWEDSSEEVLDGESTKTSSGSTVYGKTQSGTILRTDNLTERNVYEEDTTSTRTDDLTKTETRNLELESERTDNLTETNTYGKVDTRTDNLSEALSGTVSSTDSGTSGDTVHAFNSSGALPTTGNSSSNTSSGQNSETVLNTGTQAHALTGSDGKTNTGTRTTVNNDTGTVTIADEGTEQTVGEKDSTNTRTNTGTRSTTDQQSFGGTDTTSGSGSSTEDVTTTKDRSGRHFGNIGNLTSQKQILEEINLWKWNYMNEILSDVKEFCTLPVYLNASEWQLVDQDDED